jgi:hypothetical protein
VRKEIHAEMVLSKVDDFSILSLQNYYFYAILSHCCVTLGVKLHKI